MKKEMQAAYGDSIFSKSALNLKNGEEDIEYFMRKEPIKTALEIGTFRGVTSVVMSKFCQELHTIDLINGKLEEIKKHSIYTVSRHSIWGNLKIDNIHGHWVKDNNEKKKLMSEIDFDFVFIDGDHTSEGVRLDFELSKGCGRVLFHDYDEAPTKKSNVREFVNSIGYGHLETTKDFAYWTNK